MHLGPTIFPLLSTGMDPRRDKRCHTASGPCHRVSDVRYGRRRTSEAHVTAFLEKLLPQYPDIYSSVMSALVCAVPEKTGGAI